MSSTAAIELPNPVNRRTVERAHSLAKEAQRRQNLALCEAGMRLARMKHPRLLKVLDLAVEVLDSMAEEQSGRMRRDSGTPRAWRVYPTEAALWREAYATMDAGQPLAVFSWIYGAAAVLAGLYGG